VNYLLVGAFGALGAVSRYGVGHVMGPREFPFATLLVNVVGCFALGMVVAFAEDRWTATQVAAAGAGFLGAFTTFSTFAVDTVLLADRGRAALAVANVVLSVGLGLVAAFAGRAVAS
jgi:CrcB protein